MSVIFHAPRIQDPEPKIFRPETRALARLGTYWTRLAEPTGLPLWTEFDPAAVSDVLGYSFIAQCDDGFDLHLRVAGIALARLAGKPCSGQPLTCLFEARDHTALRDAVQVSSAAARPIELALALTPGAHPAHPCAVMRLYPLCDPNRRVVRFLGGVALQTRPPQPSGRFRILESAVRPAKAHRAPLRLVVDNT